MATIQRSDGGGASLCFATHAIATPQLTGRSHSGRAARTVSPPDSSRWDRNAASTRSRALTLKSESVPTAGA